MDLSSLALFKTDDLPIAHEGDVKDGKVRSVYRLSADDSRRLIESRNYPISINSMLLAMVTSDRISAFDVIWHAEEGLMGVPGKGAALNAISEYWLKVFEHEGLGRGHVVDSPHPLVWIVQAARPILVEAIARQYITGSMWNNYSKKGERQICGIPLPNDLTEHQRLDGLLITPTTKGIMGGIVGIEEKDDVNIKESQIMQNYVAFGLKKPQDWYIVKAMMVSVFKKSEAGLLVLGELLADTKLEFGYAPSLEDRYEEIIFIDELMTPDSSRYWTKERYDAGEVKENSKEGFRQYLKQRFGSDVFTDKSRMAERIALARENAIPVEEFMKVSEIYKKMSELITGKQIPKIENARAEIIESLVPYGIIR